MQSIVRWFNPPRLSRPDLEHRARALWLVTWPFLAVVATLLGISVLVEPETLARRGTTVAAVGALIVLLHAISRAGRPGLASWIFVVGLSILVTQRAWSTGGIHAPVAVFYVLFIVMAGMLIGVRGGVVTAAVCLVGAIVLTVGTAREWLTPRPGAGSPLGALVFVVLAIGLALIVQAFVARRPRRERLGVDAVEMLVHDMHSPIQAVLAHLALLRDEIRGESVQDVEAAISGAHALSRMTSSLLDVSRLEAGQMPVQRSVVDLSALADSVVSAIHSLQPTRVIAVEINGDPTCRCDAELTRRIIENLVGNAMKHTMIGGRIRVVVSGSPRTVHIAVHDEGPGVPPSMRSRIFEPFSAAGLISANGAASWGIGLAFCRLAAEAQGGTIRMVDSTTGGSVFLVELPR